SRDRDQGRSDAIGGLISIVIIEGSNMTAQQKLRTFALGLVALLLSLRPALAQMPPDASARGPNSTVFSEYRLPAVLDPEVIADRMTEVWARVYRPNPLPDNSPLLIFLHGNHATCGHCVTGTLDADGHCTDGSARRDDNIQYTTTGTCPVNYVPSPSHVGYTY